VRGFQYRGGAKTGKNPDCEPQVIELDGGYYLMSWKLACQVASMPAAKRKVWLGRNWRRARPLVKEADGTFRRRSGTHD
jgi:hypothetical protein